MKCDTCGEVPSKYTRKRCEECMDHWESHCDALCDEVRDEGPRVKEQWKKELDGEV